jgi:hypothetical protein
MGWGGHALDMIQRIRANEELKKNRRTKYKKELDAYRGDESTYKGVAIHKEKKLSRQEKAKIHSMIKRENRISLLKNLIALLIASILFILFVIYIIPQLHIF